MESREIIITLINKGKLEEAKTLIEEVGKKDEGEFHLLQGLILLKERKPNQALNSLEKAARLKEEDREIIYRAIGHALFQLDDYEDSIEAFEKIKNKTAEDYFMMFLSAVFNKDPITARTYLDESYNKDPERTKELLQLAYKAIVANNDQLSKEEKKEIYDAMQKYLIEKMKER